MPITTTAGLLSARRPPAVIHKAGVAMEAAGVWHSFWQSAGSPAASVANSAGVNGRAVTPGLVAGELIRANPIAGRAYLAQLAASANQAGTLMLIDRLWENSGLSMTLTSAQAITPAAIPARDRDGTTNGHDVMAMVQFMTAGSTGTPTVTLTYTDELGNTGLTTSFVGIVNSNLGTCMIWPLAAGDYGVRAPTSYQLSTTWTAGTVALVLFRVIAVLPVPDPGVEAILDGVAAGMPRIYNDSVLELLWLPTTITAVNLGGRYVEAHG